MYIYIYIYIYLILKIFKKHVAQWKEHQIPILIGRGSIPFMLISDFKKLFNLKDE